MTLAELAAQAERTLADDCAEMLLARLRRRRKPLNAATVHELARRMRALGAAAVPVAQAEEPMVGLKEHAPVRERG